MIKIINGVFGYNNGKSIIPKTSKDEPFSCDKATEKRLVSIGVAVYVKVDEEPVDEGNSNNDGNGDDNGKALYNDATNFDELKEIAKTLGATDEDLKPIRSKVQARELIDKLADEIAEGEPVDGPDESEIVEGEGEDDGAPNFDEVDGVEG